MRVRGQGPVPCDLLIVGEGPGYQEDRVGRPFVGRSGDELDRYLDGVTLPTRKDVFLTNVFREYRGQDYVWTKADFDADLPELLNELSTVRPSTIVTLGRYATRTFLGDVDMESTQSIPWELPETCEYYQDAVVVPIVHPAAGMRNPEMSPHVVAGFGALALYLNGDLHPRRLFDDPIPNPVYAEITTEEELDRSLQGLGPDAYLGIDTEGYPHRPWSLQYSFRPGTGYLIRATRRDLLVRFARAVVASGCRLVFHSALHDLAMLRALSVDLGSLSYDDTMVMAYLLQLEPQGLKAACLRHCNMPMMDYADVVGDVANDRVRDYLAWIIDMEQEAYEQTCDAELVRLQTTPWTDKRGRTHPGRKVRKAPNLPKSPLHKAALRVLRSPRPADLWTEQTEDIIAAGERALGPCPEATLDDVDPTVAVPYGCRDADGTVRLRAEYGQRVEALDLDETYRLEMGTYPLIDRMAMIGVKPDLEHFAALSDLLQDQIGELQVALDDQTGIDGFNANSGDQVADFLFGTLGLPEIKMTRGGRGSTNDKILEALEREHTSHPVLTTIRAYRETYKLKHTFVDQLPTFVDRYPYDGRVHATFRTTRVVTGRLAASDPNLLAQPEHGKFAKEFKRGWIAEPGHILCQWDESQVELRGLAHLSQDAVLLHAFRTGIDLHAVLAERIFGVKPKDQDKSKHRLPAKAINFGIPMGMTCRGLSVELRKNGVDADEDTAQRWLDETLGLYVGVGRYMEERIDEARQKGFIRCLSGRIRYIGGIRSHDDRVREEAERFAFSTPIQESATYIMKQAEKTVYDDILVPYWKQGRWVEPLLQIHDCLKLEAEEGMEQELNTVMTQAMTQVPKGFSVPLAVEGEWGPNFADMVKF